MEAILVQNLASARTADVATRCLDDMGTAILAGGASASGIGKQPGLRELGKWIACPRTSVNAGALLSLLVMRDPGNRGRLCEAGACTAMLKSASEENENAHVATVFKTIGFLACDHIKCSDAGKLLWGAIESTFTDFDYVSQAARVLCGLGHGGSELIRITEESSNAILVGVALRYLARTDLRSNAARAINGAISALRFGDRDTFCCACAFVCYAAERYGPVALTAPQEDALMGGLYYHGDEETAVMTCGAVSRLNFGECAKRKACLVISSMFKASRSALCLSAIEGLLRNAGDADYFERDLCGPVVEEVARSPESALRVITALSSNCAYQSELGRLGACEAVSSVVGHVHLVSTAASALCEGNTLNAARMKASGMDIPAFPASAA